LILKLSDDELEVPTNEEECDWLELASVDE
jgi:hypothetical protein